MQDAELTTSVNINDVDYLVHTEELGDKLCKAVSMVYREGQVIYKREKAYHHLSGTSENREALDRLLRELHKSTIEQFTAKCLASVKKKNDYFRDAKALLRDGKTEGAIQTLKDALERFPGDPYLMSYFGCLLAVSGKQPADGVKMCMNALQRLKATLPFGSEVFYPSFYLNLGRAYAASGQKAEAIKAFTSGLRVDPEDRELLQEMKKIGIRKKPPIPFLRRTNPINKYIGMLTRGKSRG